MNPAIWLARQHAAEKHTLMSEREPLPLEDLDRLTYYRERRRLDRIKFRLYVSRAGVWRRS